MTSDGGRVVVVTGASSGIGRAAAHLCADAGDHVVLLARGRTALEAAERECVARGAASTHLLVTDIGDDAAVAEAVRTVLERYGRIDGVIHSAGVVAYGRTEEVPVELFDAVVRTNLLGSVNLVRHVLPGMRERNRGAFVQIGSVIGHIAAPTMTAYSVTKWGVRNLARQLHIENLDRSGVHISYVSPGGVDTPIYLQAANITRAVGRPPPPVDPPEKVARAAVRRLDHPRPRTQVGLANGVIRLGFSAAPWVYDRLVGVLFPLAAVDLATAPQDTEGNVLRSREELNRLRGQQGSVLLGIRTNLRRLRTPAPPPPAPLRRGVQ